MFESPNKNKILIVRFYHVFEDVTLSQKVRKW